MELKDAEYLAARLFASFPSNQGQATAAVYVEAIQRLHDPDIALRAIEDLVYSERWLPPIAAIRETYERHRPMRDERELPMPELTEEKIADNLRRRNILLDMLAKKIDMNEALARMNG